MGRIDEEPPEFHCEVIADGMRFRVPNLDLILEGYHERRPDEVPARWLDQVAIETQKPYSTTSYTSYGSKWASEEVLEAELTDEDPAQPRPANDSTIPSRCSNNNGEGSTLSNPPSRE